MLSGMLFTLYDLFYKKYVATIVDTKKYKTLLGIG